MVVMPNIEIKKRRILLMGTFSEIKFSDFNYFIVSFSAQQSDPY